MANNLFCDLLSGANEVYWWDFETSIMAGVPVFADVFLE